MSYGTITPNDEHNRALLANVHPPDWKNPDPASRYNLVVIGAGTAGLVTAIGAAGLGARVALVERHLMGGDCLNVGCVPSKALIRAGRWVGEMGRAEEFGARAPSGGAPIDFERVMERVRRVRAELSPIDSAKRFQENGVDVFLGEGRFTGPRTVRVEGTELRFARAVVATGGRAVAPPIPGLQETGYLTNETIFSLGKLPPRLVVIGGGPIGCELAQAFRRLGSQVVLLHEKDHILEREDADAAAIVQNAFVRDGIRLALSVRVEEVKKHSDGKRIRFQSGGQTEEIVADEILVAAGRRPNVEGLGLESAGVEYDPVIGVKVDDHLRSTNSRIFAAGDVGMAYRLTHAADAAARIVIQNALFRGRKKVSALTIPWCTYTDPEVAHVGLYAHQAKERGIPISTFSVPLSEVDRAVTDGETEGFVKILVKKGTDRILGGTVVAAHAGDLISEITLAMTQRIGLGRIAEVIHPYPTQAEGIRKVANAYNRTRLTPRVKRLFDLWMRWTR
jgi:pyruvate/2-oxoglutarate dehydrogenase complex dihydrolipoamide dehydrogenase (E3) component